MTRLDWAVIGVHFVAVVGIFRWSSRKQHTSADHFLTGRNVGWFAVGALLFAPFELPEACREPVFQ